MESFVKSYWVTPNEHEQGAPEKRIIHGKYIRFDCVQTGLRLGFQMGQGYFKCGSDPAVDWVENAEVYIWTETGWKCVAEMIGLEKPMEKPQWICIDEPTQAIFVSVRKSGIDCWWPCYSLVYTGFLLDNVTENAQAARPVRALHKVQVTGKTDEALLSEKGISYTQTSVMAKYQTDYYSVGFKLKSIGLNYFACDGEGTGNTQQNLLDVSSIMKVGVNTTSLEEDCYRTQGFVLNSVQGKENCGMLQYALCGETEVDGNTLTYHAVHRETGQEVTLCFTMERQYIALHIRRVCRKDVMLIDSGVFRIATNSMRATMTALGQLDRQGETGRLQLPVTVNFPGHSNIVISGTGAGLRFNSIRANLLNNLDIQIGERPAENGCYRLEKGVYEADLKIEFNFDSHVTLKENTPVIVSRAIHKHLLSGLTFRADVDAFTNNGNSMGCPICLDGWAELCEAIGNGENGVQPWGFLKSTLEHHLLGTPAYAAGMHASGTHRYEDEYLATGAGALYGIAVFMRHTKDKAWFLRYKDFILEKINQMKARDVDQDGLIESTIRKGLSGQHQWSTCWYDVISFGYKDAFSNAILYSGLRELQTALKMLDENLLAADISEWLTTMKRNYRDTFITKNGWLAGWRCMDNQLHDYGFLAVNGLAVKCDLLEGLEAKQAIGKLYQALLDTGFDSFDLGLPGNVFEIDEQDLALAQKDLPFGGYQNAGITLSQSRHFINGLYAVGMTEQADHILYEISKGLLYNNVIAGTTSGVDWRTWDGTPSGYEGILCDQFGVFESLLNRYRQATDINCSVVC